VSAEQQAAVADGTVTLDEYEKGFRRYSACLELAGFALIDVATLYQVITYGTPAAAVESGDDKRCYDGEFAQIDSTWQVGVEDQSEVAGILGRCLASRGMESSGTQKEKLDRLDKNGITVETCMAET
jgi:hypothetical protein